MINCKAYFHKKILAQVETVLKLFLDPRIQDYVTPLTVGHQFQIEIGDESFSVLINAPLPMEIHPRIEEIEGDLQVFIKKHGLYEGKEIGVAASKFGWLASLVMPVLGYNETLGLAKYFLALFAHDDALDKEKVDPSVQKAVNQIMEDVLQGNTPLLDAHPNRIKAIKEVFDEYFKPLKTKDSSFKYFFETLRKYLSSIESEAHAEWAVLQLSPLSTLKTKTAGVGSPKPQKKFSEIAYEANRPETSGIYNAFAATCLLLGINSENVEKTHADVRHMIDFMVQAASWLNDVVSAPKELSALKKKFSGLSVKDLKTKVTSNMVLIKWRDGRSFEDAVMLTLEKYNKALSVFYELKGNLEQSGAMADREVKALVVTLEGWFFGHPLWCGSGRYNKGVPAKWLESPFAFRDHVATLK
ncbi:MAG: hypothetical protein EXS67_05640 [Candidatus Margulisbacteria bacterium]|nr:hypothetical protein [Candidatus Margulisiibacteriota bacterium]